MTQSEVFALALVMALGIVVIPVAVQLMRLNRKDRRREKGNRDNV